VEFALPLELGAARELSEQVGVTTLQGLGSGGFTNQEVRIDGISLNLDDFIATIKSRVYREQERNPNGAINYELDASITMTEGMNTVLDEGL
jgi:hypothetical protein